jgi:dolichyl-phosphate beta-glucosyltransferase
MSAEARATLVIPCYNEEKRLRLDRFEAFLAGSPAVGLLFVDDGSRDGTRALLQAFCAASKGRASMLSLSSNAGKAEAVRRGMLAAADETVSFVGYWDADLATPLETFDLFLAEFAGHLHTDLVMGSRVLLLGRTIERRAIRHYAGRVIATAVSSLLRLAVYDTQCGAKLFRVTPEVRYAFAAPFLSRWLFDVEVLARLGIAYARRGGPPLIECVRELPLPEWHDVTGSKISWTDIFGVCRDLFKIRRWLRRAHADLAVARVAQEKELQSETRAL